MDRSILQEWVIAALKELGGRGTLIDVSKAVWRAHESELRQLGDLFYTWQYDLRWAATRLRHQGRLRGADEDERGVWSLSEPWAKGS